MDVTVCTGTFGDPEWAALAQTRAGPSVAVEGVPWVHVHGDTLAGARNAALEQVTTEWVCVLDSDDEILPGYFEAMGKGTADLRAPSVSYQRKHHQPRHPAVPKVAGHQHECTAECITSGAGNWLVVGTAVRAEMVRAVGGWHEYEVYEDFDLWMRVLLTGATVEAVPDAIYRAHVRFDSRNRAPDITAKNRVHYEIVAANLGEQAA